MPAFHDRSPGDTAALSYFTASLTTGSVLVTDNAIRALIGGILTPLLLTGGLLTLARVMRGRARAIRFSTLTRLCKVLDCQPGDLLTWRKEPES